MADGATVHGAMLNDDLDIEARQDELLRQLDELNHRVERALVALVGDRGTTQRIAGMVPSASRRTARAA